MEFDKILINQSTNRSVNRTIDQSINRTINLSINHSINQSINRSNNRLIENAAGAQTIRFSRVSPLYVPHRDKTKKCTKSQDFQFYKSLLSEGN